MKFKTWVLYLVGILLVTVFQLHAAPPDNHPNLIVELQDGSRVIGKSSDESFKFDSDILGSLKLALSQVSSVEFSPKTNLVKLATVNGDRISAKLENEEIHLVTSFGKITIPADTVKHIQVTDESADDGTEAGLIALWSGEGNGNDSVGNNPARWLGPMRFMDGKKGRSFFLDGYNSYLLIHPDESLDVGKADAFTFSCWFKPSTVMADMIIFEFEQQLGTANGSDVGMELAIHRNTPDGQGASCLYVNLKDDTDASHVFASPPNLLQPNVWQHVALTYEKTSGIGILYLNGQEVSRANLGSFTPQTSFGNLLLGAKTTYNSVNNPGNAYLGGLDEFGIYNRALSADEIQAIYNRDN